jgi:uncharacterized protein YrzB (UPF0473 family)
MEEQLQDNIITLIDENGAEIRFDLLLSFDYEDKRYIALLPLDPVDGVGEDEVVLLEAVDEDGEEQYRGIESPILLEEVFNEFLELFDEEISENDEE